MVYSACRVASAVHLCVAAMVSTRSSILAVLFTLVGVTGCDRAAFVAPPPPPPQDVIVKITSDEEAVPGAQVGGTGIEAALTNDKGEARIALGGPDGTSYDVILQCPEGYGAPAHPIKVTVRRSSKTPEYSSECKRLGRIAVVAIKSADPLGKIPYVGVPVKYLGREIGRLDENGMALVSFHARVGDSFTLQLDTSDPKFTYMRPISPEKTFSIRDDDDIFVLNQTFTEERPVVRRVIPRGPYIPRPL